MSNRLACGVINDEITRELSNSFDYSFDGISFFDPPNMPDVPADYSLGLIVGPSGTGKSTLLQKFGIEHQPEWVEHRAVCSHFDNATSASERLAATGLNSIPAWMKPYSVLSTGEKFRADMARRLIDDAVIDEFTSVVDRNVAASCSNAIQRYIREKGLRRVTFATCHYDVIEWLQPDWVFDTLTKSFQQVIVRRPPIELEIMPCSTEIWPLFKEHHYLDGSVNKSSRCWIASWRDVPIGFASALAFPNRNFKNAWREHRTVVLPDFQGLGIGVRLSDAVAQMMLDEGCRYFSKTSHPRMGEYREKSPLWKPTSKNRKARSDYTKFKGVTKEDGHKMRHVSRICYSHEYTGI